MKLHTDGDHILGKMSFNLLSGQFQLELLCHLFVFTYNEINQLNIDK